MSLDPRKTVFVGGVPRPLKAGKYYTYLNYEQNAQKYNRLISKYCFNLCLFCILQLN